MVLCTVPNKKETRKSSYFSTEIESFIKYEFHSYKVQFIFFHLTPKMRCNTNAWPSKNNVNFQCQNQVAQNKWLRSVCTADSPLQQWPSICFSLCSFGMFVRISL